MGHLNNLEDIRFSKARHTYIAKLLDNCFNYDERESNLNLREYLDSYTYVIFQGEELCPDSCHFYLTESSVVPEKYLIEALELKEAKEDCKEWIRIWSNYCAEFTNFIKGLPGEANEFESKSLTEKWEEMAQGEAFAELEGRIFAYKLLKEK